MQHNFRINGKIFTIEMGCNHPDMRGNTTESVGCNGDCEECGYSIASTTIPQINELIRLANNNV